MSACLSSCVSDGVRDCVGLYINIYVYRSGGGWITSRKTCQRELSGEEAQGRVQWLQVSHKKHQPHIKVEKDAEEVVYRFAGHRTDSHCLICILFIRTCISFQSINQSIHFIPEYYIHLIGIKFMRIE